MKFLLTVQVFPLLITMDFKELKNIQGYFFDPEELLGEEELKKRVYSKFCHYCNYQPCNHFKSCKQDREDKNVEDLFCNELQCQLQWLHVQFCLPCLRKIRGIIVVNNVPARDENNWCSIKVWCGACSCFFIIFFSYDFNPFPIPLLSLIFFSNPRSDQAKKNKRWSKS